MSVQSDIDFNINEALKKVDILTAEVRRGFKDQERAVDQSGSKMEQSSSKTMQNISRLWTAAAAFIATKVVTALGQVQAKLFELSAAFEEAQSKFRITFGDESGTVDSFVDTFGRLAGLSKTEGREITATLGAVALGFGASKIQAADFAQEVVRAAADMASFNNSKMPEMLTAIRSGLAGEIEPLRRYGIELSAANVQQVAMEMSGKRNAEALSSQEMVYARLALIQKQAAVQMGDLERTAFSASNQYRKLTANLRIKGETIALKLLPFFTDLITAANSYFETSTDLVTAIKTTNDELANLADSEDALQVVQDLQSKSSLTADEQVRLAESLALLQDQFPGFVSQVDDAGVALSFYTGELQKLIDTQKDSALIKISSTFPRLIAGFDESIESIEDLKKRRDDILAKIMELESGQRRDRADGDEFSALFKEAQVRGFRTELAQVGVDIQGLQADTRNFNREISGLMDLLGDERIVTAFMASGRSAEQARAFVADLRAESETFAKQEEERRKKDAQTQERLDAERRQREQEASGLEGRLKVLREEQKVLVQQDDATDRLAEVNREIYEIEKRRSDLLEAGVKDIKEQEENFRRIEEIHKRIQKEQKNAVSRVGFAGMDERSFLEFFGVGQGDRKPTSREMLTQTEYGRTVFSEEALRDMKMPDDLLDFQKELNARLQEAYETHNKLVRSIRNMASASRSVLRLADTFGVLSDEVSNALNGVVDIMDNYASLKELRVNMDASFLDKLVPWAGIASGAITVVSSMFSNDKGDRIEDAVRENTRRIEKAVREANEDPRPGSDLSSDLRNKIASELLVANAQLSGTLQSGIAGSEYTGPILDRFKDLFKTLSESEVFDEDVLKALQENLKRALTSVVEVRYENDGSETRLLDKAAIAKAQQDIADLLDSVLGGGGSFNRGTVGGALQEAQFLQQFGGVGSDVVFQLMLDNLIALVDEGNDTNALLKSLRGLDPVKDAELIRTIMEEYARRIADPSDLVDLGALSPSDFDDIFNAITGLLDGGTGSDPGQSLSASVSRSITEVRAELLTDLTRDVAYWTERGALAAEALLSLNRGHTAVQGQGSAALSVQNTFNGITPTTRREAHRALDDAMEEAVRLRERRLF